MYLHNGSGLVKLCAEQTVPEGNGEFSEFRDFKQVLQFRPGRLFCGPARTSGEFNDNQCIYFHNGSALVNVPARMNSSRMKRRSPTFTP